MSSEISSEKAKQLVLLDPQQRAEYLLNEFLSSKTIWILRDEHGCVMLNTEEEDCVPVWPHKESALMWATGEWSDCVAVDLSLKDWQEKWLSGLEEDELAIAVFPDLDGEGIVLYPHEFAEELKIGNKK